MSIGIIFIVIGVLLVLKAVFPIAIPIGKIVVAGFFIYLGITMLIPSGRHKHDNENSSNSSSSSTEDSIVFSNGTIRPTLIEGSRRELNVVFGSGVIDLTQLKIDRPTDIHVNAVFGSADVEINPAMPVAFEISSVLGATSVPEKTHAATPANAPVLTLKLNSVFGRIQVTNKP